MELLLLILLSIYSARILFFNIGAFVEKLKSNKKNKGGNLPFISIIVPARNEEHNIQKCIFSISANTYPKDKFEIIAVNDRSTDSTGKILEDLSLEISNLVIKNISEVTKNENLKGKPGAIQSGFDIAKGSVVIMTDADCTVNQNWIQSIVETYNDSEVGMVAAFTNINGKNIFENFQAVEWVYLHTMASAGVALKAPLGCYGNNLSIRKEIFDSMGGYRKIKFSVTEDLALLQGVFKIGRKVRYLCTFDSKVDTHPCKTFSEYLSQHHRWTVGGMNLGWKAVLFIITSISVYLGLVLSIVHGHSLFIILFIALRYFGDFSIILPSLFAIKQVRLLKWFIPAIPFFIFMEMIIPFLLFKKDIVWKDQIFKRKH